MLARAGVSSPACLSDSAALPRSPAIIGIGINLRLPTEVAATIDQPSIDIAALTAEPPSRNRLAGRLLSRLIETLDRFGAQGFAAFAGEYARHDLLSGQPLRVQDANGTFDGTGAGVDERGALRVRHDGKVRSYDSAEVSCARDGSC